MILIMEFMEKTIHLNKLKFLKQTKKNGMTLIEIVCSLCIICILFLSISSILMFTAKGEARTASKLDNLSYAKAVMDIVSDRSKQEYEKISKEDEYYYFGFGTMEELQDNFSNSFIENLKVENEMTHGKAKEIYDDLNKKYVCCMKVEKLDKKVVGKEGELFHVKVTMWNMERDNNNEICKEIYISQ